MLMPSIFGENLFDDWFDEFPFYDMDKEMNNTEKKLYGKKAGRIMKTDIKEIMYDIMKIIYQMNKKMHVVSVF